MPSTTVTGTKSAPRRQAAKTTTDEPKQEAAPATAAPTPPAAQTGESMFDDTPPAPPAAEQPPVDPANSGTTSEPMTKEQVSEEPGDAQEPKAPAVPEPAAPSAPEAKDEPAAPPPPPAPTPPAPVEQQEPEKAADEPQADEPAATQAPSGAPTRVRLGRVEGALHRVPLEVVQMLVAESGSRIETLRSSPSIADLQNRMRVSEGRCAPIFFTMAVTDQRPFLFSGVEAVAAAINLDLQVLSVVTIAAEDAAAAQQHLSSHANGKAATTQDDVLEVIG